MGGGIKVTYALDKSSDAYAHAAVGPEYAYPACLE